MSKCEICQDTGWVCENCDTQWEIANGETCCGAGKSCVCNPNGDVQWQVVYATVDSEGVEKWAH